MDVNFDKIMREIEETRSRFDKLYDGLSSADVSEVSLPNGWSAKDLLGHIAYWDQWLSDWLNGSDEEVSTWDEVHRRNELNYQTKQAWSWAQVQADAESTYAELTALLNSLPAETLNDESVQKYIAVSTFEHYSEHHLELEAAITEWRSKQGEV